MLSRSHFRQAVSDLSGAAVRLVLLIIVLSAAPLAALGQTDAYNFDFGDLPDLEPEHAIIGLGGSISVDPASRDYLVVSSVDASAPECFNYQERVTQTVSIIGKQVILQAGHANGLYEAYFAEGNADIKELLICAESVIVRSPVYVPGGNIVIHARSLRFEDVGGGEDNRARLITTPPAGAAHIGGCTLTGQDAGSVTLHVESFDPGGSTVRFELRGSDGWEVVGADQPTFGTSGKGGNVVSTVDVSAYVSQDGGLPAVGAGTLKSVGVFLAPTPFWLVPHTGGDREFKGHGPNVEVDAWLEIRGERELWLRVNFDALETQHDWTHASGETSYQVYTHSRPIVAIVSDTSSHVEYQDHTGSWGNTESDVHYLQEGELVHFFSIVADTSGDDAGVDTGVSVTLNNPATILELDTDDPTATGPGAAGGSELIPAGYSWLHPLALRMVLAHAGDLYFFGNLDEARATLGEYQMIIAALKGSADWADLSAEQQADVNQAQDEIEALLYRLASNLDYYGNPAGWVPMLSFEIEHRAFEQEIERAFRILYTCSWITRELDKHENKVVTLNEAKRSAQDEVAVLTTRYAQTVDLVGELKAQATEISREISDLERELQVLELDLQRRAEDKFRTPWWKKALKGVGALLKVVPLYQPALGTIGKGFDLVGNINVDDPWSTVEGIVDLSREFNGDLFKASAEQFENTIKTLDLANLSDPEAYVKNLRAIAEPIGQGLESLKQSLRGTGAPRDKVEAELQRLKATDPAFNQIVDQVAVLMTQKEAFVGQLATATQALADFAGGITQNILAVDAINRSLQDGRAGIDPRVGAYARAMEQRAKDRLRLYQYHFMKAYEYRMLQPYPGERDLVGVLERFRATVQAAAAAGSDAAGGLSRDQFLDLSALYLDALSNIATEILQQYRNGQGREFSSSARLLLALGEVDRLNAGEVVRINLVERSLFFANEENLRITNIAIEEVEVTPSGPYGFHARMSINVSHSGISRLTKDGETYLFRHYNEATGGNAITWGAVYDGIADTLQALAPSAASESLLSAIVPGASANDLLIYSRPAAWADLAVSKLVQADGGVDMRIARLVLRVDYDYEFAASDKAILEVRTVAKNGNLQLRPVLEVSRTDLNGRDDGMGDFRRSYSRGAAVSITAPGAYGQWVFNGWTDHQGTPLGEQAGYPAGSGVAPGDTPVNPTLTVDLNQSKVVRAVYVCTGAGCEEWAEPASDPCADLECGPGRVCVDGACVSTNPCADVVCPEGQACSNGECVPVGSLDCTTTGCPEGQYCLGGVCVSNSTLCPYRNDGECDDGRPGSLSDLCSYGTDPEDCAGVVALDPCPYRSDGECDDGRAAAATYLCAYGTDPEDCEPPTPSKACGAMGMIGLLATSLGLLSLKCHSRGRRSAAGPQRKQDARWGD
ncbi:MAG TPA: hypothetical protein PKK06_10615 [Phycisphaerae bacterium]|nr:hypothetical protein [Phycisphaerae bacterium]HNU44979.1 hypothetical protein [Phycisphaerae bacterium]